MREADALEAVAVPWHAASADQVFKLAGSSPNGLTKDEAAKRLAGDGPNILPPPPRVGLPVRFLRQFHSPLIYLLLAATLVSLLIGDRTDAVFIALVLVVNALIGTVQEQRAETSMAALQHLIRHVAHVRRDGATIAIDAAELVVGDLVTVESGMAVPADLRLVTASGLSADEAALTGESMPVHKSAESVAAAHAGVGDRPSLLHAGTIVTEGRGTGVVVAIGSATELGRIDASLRAAPASPPPLMLRLHRLARQIAAGAVLLIVLLAALLTLQGESVEYILLLSVALAVSAIPEGLPIAVTVALGAATRRMARRRVIVRALPAVEGLGACTVIATDKTGTLTQNRLSVESLLLPDRTIVPRHAWSLETSGGSLQALGQAAAICNEARITPEGALVGDSVDTALLRYAADVGIDLSEAVGAPRVWQLPYEPARRIAAAAIEGKEGLVLYVKGAPETVLPMCGAPDRERLADVEALAAGGYRVIALARRRLEARGGFDAALQDLDVLGFAALTDPVRPEVPAAVARCQEAGVSVRMVTGDHPATALSIAREVGIAAGPEQVVTGAMLSALDHLPWERAERIREGRVFARIDPTQKLLIVSTLSEAGELVAVTGDGVNDAPALQAAHIGVAMGRTGTDVARGASDLVLADDNFASIVGGIEEGRITYANVRKIVIFLIATGMAEIFMFFGALAVGLPLPLTPVQLLWSNLVTNGAQDVMLGFGRGEGDELRRPPRPAAAPILDGSAIALMVPPALAMTIMALLMMNAMIASNATVAEARNAVLLFTVLFQNAYVISMRSERRPIWREPLASNPLLLLGVLIALSLHFGAMMLTPLQAVLGTAPVEPSILLLCLGGGVLIVLIAEITKAWVGHRRAG